MSSSACSPQALWVALPSLPPLSSPSTQPSSVFTVPSPNSSSFGPSSKQDLSSRGGVSFPLGPNPTLSWEQKGLPASADERSGSWLPQGSHLVPRSPTAPSWGGGGC